MGGSLSPSPDDCACHIQEGTWNKVGMLRKILEDTPRERAEWIVYMQPETFFDDTTFSIPFDSYRDKDLVLIGNETALRSGQMRGESRSRTSPAAVKIGMVLICRWPHMTMCGGSCILLQFKPNTKMAAKAPTRRKSSCWLAPSRSVSRCLQVQSY